MDLNKLEAKKEKKKVEATPVRINKNLYEKLKGVADTEGISIIKLTEFFLENAIEDYNLTKIGNNKKNINPDYIVELILNLLDVHMEIIKDSHNDEKRMLASVEEMKKSIISKLLPYM